MVTLTTEPRYGVSPSMEGSADDEVVALADHLRRNVPLGHDGREAMRMSHAEYLRPDQQLPMMRMAVEITMRELLQNPKKAA